MPSSENHVKRNVGPNKVHEKPKNFKKAIGKLLGYDKKLTPFYIVAMAFAVISSVCSIIGPNKISDLTDAITKGLRGGINFEEVKGIAIFLIILYLVSAILSFLTSFIMATTANKLAKSLRTKISEKINNLPLRYFDKHSFGDILSKSNK